MTVAHAFSVALVGLEGRPVEVEVMIGGGLPRTVLVGLPDTALYEARDRCKAAIASSGLEWPRSLVTINLSPASLPKAGTHYDLAIAAAVLSAAGSVRGVRLNETVFLGEVGLDGRVRPVRGILPAVLAAALRGFARAVVPAELAAEARLVADVEVCGVSTLAQLVAVLDGEPLPEQPQVVERSEVVADEPAQPKDLRDVAGQLEARWALEVAAAGRHHLHFHGPPGVGKTMLAERLPGLLPELTPAEALQVSAVHSLAGIGLAGLVRRAPYAAPHHSASVASVIGGGARLARPGLISVAHRGVLFLDEAAEFPPKVLDGLRTPLELGEVTIGRSEVQARFPADFQLVLASNPCPCGMASTPGAVCTCNPMAIRRYAERVSGPIRDRIDISQLLVPMKKSYLRQALRTAAEPSAVVAARVAEARARQAARLAGTGWVTNAEVSGSHLRTQLPLPAGLELVDTAVARGRLSPRGVDRVLRLSWTVADLAGRDRPSADDLVAALGLRRGEAAGRRELAS
ncbi:YifB family Mg chelatase-like AAA ATPase [Microlunatus sp. Y2014]|uniref:YifB family Mg chelatase-like AAA ATPase n=1 Tax=Microlunatus sp. Y2014 TaxID=3418488 RepID=UPI003DA74E6F